MKADSGNGAAELTLTGGVLTTLALALVGRELGARSLVQVVVAVFVLVFLEQAGLTILKCQAGRVVQALGHALVCATFVLALLTMAVEKCESGGTGCSGSGQIPAYPEAAIAFASFAAAVALAIAAFNYLNRDRLLYT